MYILNSIRGSGPVKYKRNSLTCKMNENSACDPGDLVFYMITCKFDMATHLLQNVLSGHIKVKKGVAMYVTQPLPVALLRV